MIPESCRLCSEFRQLRRGVVADADVRIDFCPACCHYSLYWHGLMEGDPYPNDYEPYWPPLAEEDNLWLRWQRRRHVVLGRRLVERAHPVGGRCLDVGCATGAFAQELASTGRWEVVGMDTNPGALETARSQGVNAILAELTDAPFNESFDVITLWEVIEHLNAPLSALKAAFSHLRPGGSLFLSTPNGRSLQRRWWGRHWAGWSPPYHLHVFSLASLDGIIRRAGFTGVNRRSLAHERYYFQTSLRSYLGTRIQGDIRRNLALLLVNAMAIGVWPLFRGIDHLRSASSLVIEATKRA